MYLEAQLNQSCKINIVFGTVLILAEFQNVVNHSLCAVLRPRTPETRLVSEDGETRMVPLKAVRLCRRS